MGRIGEGGRREEGVERKRGGRGMGGIVVDQWMF